MCFSSFGSGTVCPACDFDDATVGVRLQGGRIIYPKQSTQSGGGLWRGTSMRWDMCPSHHRCWADRKYRHILESTRSQTTGWKNIFPWSKVQITVPWHTPISNDSRLHSNNSAFSCLSKEQHNSILYEHTKYTHHYKQHSKIITT